MGHQSSGCYFFQVAKCLKVMLKDVEMASVGILSLSIFMEVFIKSGTFLANY